MLVKSRLQINLAVAVITAFVIIMVLFLALYRVDRAMEEASVAGEIITGAFERSTLRSDYLRTDSDRVKKQWFAKHEQVGGLLKLALERFRDAEDKIAIEELIADQAATGKIFSEIVANREKPRPDAASTRRSRETESRLVGQLEMRLYDKILHARKLDEAAGRRLLSALRQAGGAIICLLAIVTAAAAINSWTMHRVLAERIGRLRDGALVIGGGNLDHRINIEGKDEFAELSQAFDAMTAKLRSSYRELEYEIAERKRAEELIAKNEARLKRAQDIAHLGSWELDVVNDILIWSDEVYRIFGQPREFGATYEAFLEAVHPDDRAAVEAAYTGSLREGRDTYEIEHRVVRKSTGEIRYVHERCEHVRDDAGRIIMSAGMVHDITERKRAEDALQKLNEELELRVAQRTEELEKIGAELETQNAELQETYQELEMETAARIQAMEELREKDRMMIQQSRMAAMGEMLGNIAHQWRQPLNILGLMIQDLGLSHESGQFSKGLLDANIGKAMEIVLHLSQTIDDFSNFAAPDKEKSLFKVDQVVAKTISLVQESFRAQGITIEVSTSDEPQINGYPHEYAQVLLNILMNARDAFLERETGDARITVRSWEEDGRAVVTITDNAGGIEAEILGKIFDPYFTTKNLGKGTGVGLFMSKAIIEKNMGGRLSARNTGGGAELRIEV